MLHLFILLCVIQSMIRQGIVKYIVKNSIFLFLKGLKLQMKTNFMVLEFGYFALEKLWNRFGNFLKEFVRTLKEVKLIQ